MTTKALGLLFLLGTLVAVTLAVKAPMSPKPDYYRWGANSSNGTFNGVYGKCREYWLWNAQERQRTVQNTPCPFGPFAANIVNHHIVDASNVHIDGYDCGKWIESNSGERGAAKNPMLHAEIEAVIRLMDCTLHPENCALSATGVLSQTKAQDKAYFASLSMYSTGESCVMDAAAETYAGFGEVIYGFPTDEQISVGWPLPEITSRETYKSSRTPTRPLTVIEEVEIDRYRPLYVWQFDLEAECPVGCGRTTDGSRCVKTVV
jgi:tRNA(Arg) A34 adenosine deaminase TadA